MHGRRAEHDDERNFVRRVDVHDAVDRRRRHRAVAEQPRVDRLGVEPRGRARDRIAVVGAQVADGDGEAVPQRRGGFERLGVIHWALQRAIRRTHCPPTPVSTPACSCSRCTMAHRWRTGLAEVTVLSLFSVSQAQAFLLKPK
jgi:hypothetical protein